MIRHKLVLGSGAIFFENEEDPILNYIISLIEKKENRKMVYLPTAGHDSHDYESHVKSYCERHGIESTALYLSEGLKEEYIKEKILEADWIYAGGGNLEFLLDTWKSTKADIYLKQAYENGAVISGQSSGAMCWCDIGYDDCGPDDSFVFLEALGLFPYIICPHFEDWPSFLEDIKKEPYCKYDAIGIDNDLVISIIDGEYKVVDSERNQAHAVYYLPADAGHEVRNILKEHLPIKGLK